MNTEALIATLHTLCAAPLQLGTQLTGAMMLRLGTLALALFTAIGQLVHQQRDPRLVLAYCDLVEKFAQQVHHEQLATALDAQLSGAHALSLESFDRLRAGTCALEGEPELAVGRTCYKSAGGLLAAWLGLNYFEAQRRIDDAYLLIGRRTAQGESCEPRLPALARLYAEGGADRRSITATARRLEKLEPKDTTFDGIPDQLTARDTDGQLLEVHAARALAQLGPNAARKEISTRIGIYKELHTEKQPPALGLFIGPVIQGVHEFTLRTLASHAQVIRSIRVQSADWRTQAGKAARNATAEPDTDAPAPSPEANTQQPVADTAVTPSDPPSDPSWLQPETPMPAWAKSADEPSVADGTAHCTAQPEPVGSANDVLTPELRALNAFMAVLTATSTGGKFKPVIPRIFVYMWLSDLQNLAEAHGVTSNGVNLPPGELRRTLADANIIPVVLGGNSQPLDLGRSRRYHEGYVRAAVLARDRGCIVPDCTTPPDHVEIDHYQRAWADGGTTSVQSGAGLCPEGHHSRHVDQIKIVDVDGLPHVILPAHLDPEQKPRRNTYWGALQLGDSPDREETPPDPPEES
ncbi:DUF222 domain-containing protein [Arthrobacter sp. MYb213]|uniref:DUF222 domain-containing protein n=1 Tax=Arthrobacter sp. MYb213 TaxID=1848595 RepID=UPI0015E3E710|nr:DUF222 domain-containing protein [Arthrobacter sp. MYb213]